MEINQKFEVNEVDGKIVLKQEMTRTMIQEETLREVKGIEGEYIKLNRERENLAKSIENKEWEKTLERQDKALLELLDLKNKCETILKPYVEDLKEQIKKKVREEKISRGYKRIQSKSEKIAVQNQILGPILAEMDLDMGLPLVMEIKQGFDDL